MGNHCAKRTDYVENRKNTDFKKKKFNEESYI